MNYNVKTAINQNHNIMKLKKNILITDIMHFKDIMTIIDLMLTSKIK